MPVTEAQVKKALMPEEPDYQKAAKLGPQALPYLEAYVKGEDKALASKAAYLAGLIMKARVKKALMPEEPDYQAAAQLGPAALPALETFIEGEDEALSAKSAYLVGLIKDANVVRILVKAAASQNVLVRVAVAATAKHLRPAEASKVLITLAEDSSYGVRKMVLKSAPEKASSKLVAKIKWMAQNDLERQLRYKASEVLTQITRQPQKRES